MRKAPPNDLKAITTRLLKELQLIRSSRPYSESPTFDMIFGKGSQTKEGVLPALADDKEYDDDTKNVIRQLCNCAVRLVYECVSLQRRERAFTFNLARTCVVIAKIIEIESPETILDYALRTFAADAGVYKAYDLDINKPVFDRTWFWRIKRAMNLLMLYPKEAMSLGSVEIASVLMSIRDEDRENILSNKVIPKAMSGLENDIRLDGNTHKKILEALRKTKNGITGQNVDNEQDKDDDDVIESNAKLKGILDSLESAFKQVESFQEELEEHGDIVQIKVVIEAITDAIQTLKNLTKQ